MDQVDRKIAELKELFAAREREMEQSRSFQPSAGLLERVLWSGGQHYGQLLEAIPIPVLIYDSHGAVLFLNQAFTDTYDYSPQEFLGRKIDFVPAEAVEPSLHAWRRSMNGEKVHFTTKRRTRDGRIRLVEIHTAIIEDHEGGHLASIETHKDITDAKLAEREKLGKEKLKAAMETTGAVCHEISQPLQVIQSTVELMQMGAADRGQAEQERLQILCDCTERLGAIVRKLNLLMDFRTKHYASQTNILDLDLSAGDYLGDCMQADGPADSRECFPRGKHPRRPKPAA